MNRVGIIMLLAIGCLLIAFAAPLTAATPVDQRAVKFGTALPATCYTGDIFFNTTAAAGSNLYACVAVNTWAVQAAGASGFTTLSGDVNGPANSTTVTQIQGHPIAPTSPQTGQALVWNGATNRWEPQIVATTGGGTTGGASLASQLADLTAVRTDNVTLNIGASCSFTTPCNVRFGAVVYSITSGVTVSLSGGTGVALVYISNAGMITVGHNLALTCSGLCGAQSGITSFPGDAIPLFSWHATNSTWDPNGSDERAFIGSKDVIAGAGLTTTEASGHTTIAADATLIALHTTPPAASTNACSAGYWSSDANFYYLCIASNTWRRVPISSW